MSNYLIEKANKAAYGDMHKAKQDLRPLPKPRSIKQVSDERLAEKLLEAIAPSTGYPDLDYYIKGFIPGHLYTMTGVENVGKTSLACNFAVRVAKQGKKVLYFALEPENTVVDYIASVKFDKEFDHLDTDEVSDDDGNIHIYGKSEISQVDDLVRIIRELPRYDLIVIDHIGYFITSQQGWLQEQSNVIKSLAGLAKEKRSAIMMIAHLRKRGPNVKQDYKPTSDDIAGSGSFKQDSTEVMIVVRQVNNPEGGGVQLMNEGKLYITKTKCGPNGVISLAFSDRKANISSEGEIRQKQAAKELAAAELAEALRPKELWEQEEEEKDDSF
jgi:replicative DNA helicase